MSVFMEFLSCLPSFPSGDACLFGTVFSDSGKATSSLVGLYLDA